MPMLNGGKYDGRHSDWVPAAYLKTKEGKAAMGVAEPKPKAEPVPPPPVDPVPVPPPVPDAGTEPAKE